MQRRVHLERDETERSASKRELCGDMRLVRILRTDDDEARAQVEEIARRERAVRVDPERWPSQRIVIEAERRPSREPGEPSLSERHLDPREGRIAQRRTICRRTR